jgi:hypothetical protein
MIYAATQEKMAETARELEKSNRKKAKELIEEMNEQLRQKILQCQQRRLQSKSDPSK